MKASQERAELARGHGQWNHAQPELASIANIQPALIMLDKIELKKETVIADSATAEAALASRGSTVTPIPFRYYREPVYNGSNRKADNSDLNRGKETLYETPDHMIQVIKALRSSALDNMMADYSAAPPEDLIASMEMQDLPKITIQNWKPTGWFIQSPITDADVPSSFGAQSFQRSVLRRVIAKYVSVLRPTELWNMKWWDLALLDSDPPDTMTGSPTFASGDMSHTARIATLRALSVPNVSAQRFVADYNALGVQLGLPDHAVYSPCVSTRMGPLKKPLPLFVREGAGYSARYSAVGAYNRTRFVFPAPYPVNFVLSPLYVLLSGARKRILGLWHDPQSQSQYLSKLKTQGKIPYSIDFSGMDTGMFQSVIMLLLEELERAGFPAFPTQFFKEVYPMMGVILPNYFGNSSEASFLTGPAKPWCSGFKLTSEFDTLYGAAVLLSALELQHPGTIAKWESGAFTFLELGDDIMFTFPSDIDADKLASDAKSMWGAKLEIILDAMFLKWMLPVTPAVPALTRSLSRFVQQTFFNEDRYTGIEGGDRPDAVLRLGLFARLDGLNKHRDFHKYWPGIAKAVSMLGYVSRSTKEYRDSVMRGEPAMQADDAQVILEYSMRVNNYLPNLIARAKYEPSAAAVVRELLKLGVVTQDQLGSDVFRKVYMDALFTKPSPRDVNVLATLATPNFY